MTDRSLGTETDYRDLLRRVGVPLALVAGGAVLVSAGVARFVADALTAAGLAEGDAWGVGVVVAALVPLAVFAVVLRSLGPTPESRRRARVGAAVAVAAAVGYVLAPPADATLALGGLGYAAGFALTFGAVGRTVLREDEPYATSGVRVRAEAPTTGPAETRSSTPTDGGTERRDVDE